MEDQDEQDFIQAMSVFAAVPTEDISFTITESDLEGAADVNYRVDGDLRVDFADDTFLHKYGDYLRGINPTLYGYMYGTGGAQSDWHLLFFCL